MKVEFGDRVFVFEFARQRHEGKKHMPVTTTCIIRDPAVRVPMEDGHWADQFLVQGEPRDARTREISRVRALKSALEALNQLFPLDRTQARIRRSAFWSAYHGRKPDYPRCTIEIVKTGPEQHRVRVSAPNGSAHWELREVVARAMQSLESATAAEKVNASGHVG